MKADLNILIYFAPPFFFGWVGTGVFVPFLWWVFLAGLALLTEYRPGPDYNELKWRPIAFGVALIAFVATYYIARWLAPNWRAYPYAGHVRFTRLRSTS